MTLAKKLVKIGNSYGIILPKEVLRLVEIDPKKGCRISVDKHRIVVEQPESPRRLDDEVARAMVRFMKKYRSDLKRLASE